MCLLNYNKKSKKYKHITYAERTMIETWYNQDHKSKKEIAMLLHKSERTIRREIKRGIIKRDSMKRKHRLRKWVFSLLIIFYIYFCIVVALVFPVHLFVWFCFLKVHWL